MKIPLRSIIIIMVACGTISGGYISYIVFRNPPLSAEAAQAKAAGFRARLDDGAYAIGDDGRVLRFVTKNAAERYVEDYRLDELPVQRGHARTRPDHKGHR